MIKDILEDIDTIDVLVSTEVVKGKDGMSAHDCCLHYVQKSGHDLIQYFTLTLDTQEFTYEKQCLYNAIGDKDYATNIEQVGDTLSFTQYRKATEVERMLAWHFLVSNKGYIRDLSYHFGYKIPTFFVDQGDDWNSRPMVITFPDYV